MTVIDWLAGRRSYNDKELNRIADDIVREQKAALYATTVGALTKGNPQRTTRDLSQYAHEGYKLNSVIYACVQRIAKVFGIIKWQVVTADEDDPQLIPNHPLTKLLKRPNSQMGGKAFFEAYAVNYWLFGNGYIDATTMMNNITELWLPKPFRIEPVPGQFGIPERYIHTVNAATRSWWFDENGLPDLSRSDNHMLMHGRTANPTNDAGADWYGMAPMEAAAYSVDQHNAASVHNKSLLDNGMTPSGVFSYEPPLDSGLEATMSTVSYNRLKTLLREKQQGSANAGNNLVLDGFMKFTQAGMTPKDGDFNETKKGVAREICNVFGVPFILVVEGQSTYNNVREARLELSQENVLPFAERFAADFTAFIQNIYPDVAVVPDPMSIPVMREHQIERAIKLDSIGHLSINEKRRLSGWLLPDQKGGDSVLVGAGLLPLDFDLDDDEGSGDDD